MTQILSFVEPGCVYLASDRRLTLLDGTVHDDHTNKCVFFDGRVVFAFTGLALMDGRPTHEWIAATLGGCESSDLRNACDRLAEQGSVAFRRLRGVPARVRHLTIVGVGWSRLPDSVLQAVRMRISNRTAQGAIQASFSVDLEHFPHGARPATSLAVDGRPSPAVESQTIAAVLRHCRRHGSDADAISSALVGSIRRSASVDPAVGRRVLTAVLPRQSLHNDPQIVIVTGPTSSPNLPSFRYWEDGIWNGITYGPSAAIPGGGYATNFKSGPILPALTPLVSRGEEGITLGYPVAALRMADGGIAELTSGTESALVVYTHVELLERAIEGPFRGATPFTLDHLAELDDLLSALSKPVDVVAFDPDPESLVPAHILAVWAVRKRQAEHDR